MSHSDVSEGMLGGIASESPEPENCVSFLLFIEEEFSIRARTWGCRLRVHGDVIHEIGRHTVAVAPSALPSM